VAEAPAAVRVNELGFLLRSRLRQVSHRLQGLAGESRLKVWFIGVFAALFWVGLLAVFLRSFAFVDRFPGLKDVLLAHLFSLLFFALMVMLIFSTGVISFGSLFRSNESHFLLTQPVSPQSIVAYKFIESLLFGSWALVFLGAPALVAYGLSSDVPLYFFPMSLLVFVPFVAVPAALGTAASMLLVRFVPRGRRRALLWIAWGGGVALLVLLYRLRLGLRAYMPFSEAWLWNVLKRFGFVRSALLPSYWVTESILSLGQGNSARALFFFLVIISNVAFLILLLHRFATRSYLLSYSLSQGLSRRNRRRGSRLVSSLVGGLFWYLPKQTRLLIGRDVVRFVRDPVQWSQVLIFFGLLAIYFFNLRQFYYQIAGEFWKVLVSLLNLGATSLTLATFISRFAYPQVSLEAQRMWVVGLAPVSRRLLIIAKFLSALVGSVVLAAGLVGLSNWMLRLPWTVAAAQMLVAAMVAAGLSGLGIGLGACFPNLKESDPSKIVAGFGGTLSLVAGLGFLIVMLTFAVFLTHLAFDAAWAVHPQRSLLMVGGMVVVLAVGLAVAITPMVVGVRRFERMEF